MDENGNIAYRSPTARGDLQSPCHPHIVALYDSFYDVPDDIHEYMGDYDWNHQGDDNAILMTVDFLDGEEQRYVSVWKADRGVSGKMT